MPLDKLLTSIFGSNSAAARDLARREAEAAQRQNSNGSNVRSATPPINPVTPDENRTPPRPANDVGIADSEFQGFSPELAQQNQELREQAAKAAARARFGDEFRTEERIEEYYIPDLPPLEAAPRPKQFQWVPNPLSVYANTNFRWRFFVVRDSIALSSRTTTETLLRAAENSNQGVILFETGSTGFNIKSVEMENFVGVDWWNKNAQVTEFKMVVAEPMGIALVDSLFLAAQSLEIKNYLKTPYFLQLDFIGTNEQGQDVVLPAMSSAQAELVGLQSSRARIPSTWIWRVQILNVETQLGPAGATHTITMRPFTEVGLTEYFLNAKTNITIDGITTIGDLLDRLEEAINKQFRDNNDGHTVKFDILPYVPITGQNLPSGNPNPRTWQIVPREFARRNLRSASFVRGDATKVTIGSREALNEVIQEAIGITKEAQELRKFERSGRQRVDAIVLWKLRSEVFEVEGNNSFNFVNNTYNYNIRYVIVPYETNQVITDGNRQQIQQPRNKTLETLLERNRRLKLVKRYDYLFTGLNTEVLELDLNLNTAWIASLPLYDGANSFGQTEAGPAIDQQALSELSGIRQNLDALANLQQQIENLLGRVRSGEIVRSDDFNRIFNEASPQVADTVQRLRQIASERRGIFTSEQTFRREQVEGFERSVREAIAQNQRALQDKELQRRVGEEVQAIIRRRANDIRNRAGGVNLNYIELLNEALEGRFDRQLPISLRPDNFENRAEVDRSTELGGNLEEGRNRLVYATILNQAKNTQDFLKIDLTIKGDPYWLGNNHYGSPITTLEPHTMNPDLADVMFLLTFKLPSGIDDNGNVKLNNADVYNGVYIALSVKSIFENGKFYQTITAMRDVLVPLPPNFDLGTINYV